MTSRDKCKDIGILLEHTDVIELPQEVVQMVEKDPELLNTVYKEISENLGMDTALEIYRMFKGQQISFPMRFFNPQRIQKIIVQKKGCNLVLQPF